LAFERRQVRRVQVVSRQTTQMRLRRIIELPEHVEQVVQSEIFGMLQRLEPAHHFVNRVLCPGHMQFGENPLQLLAVGQRMIRTLRKQSEDH
jgi:hypothetical protein